MAVRLGSATTERLRPPNQRTSWLSPGGGAGSARHRRTGQVEMCVAVGDVVDADVGELRRTAEELDRDAGLDHLPPAASHGVSPASRCRPAAARRRS